MFGMRELASAKMAGGRSVMCFDVGGLSVLEFPIEIWALEDISED